MIAEREVTAKTAAVRSRPQRKREREIMSGIGRINTTRDGECPICRHPWHSRQHRACRKKVYA